MEKQVAVVDDDGSCSILDSSHHWQQLPPLPQYYGTDYAACAMPTGLLVAGGSGSRRDCHQYITTDRVWKQMADMKTCRWGAAAVLLGGRMFVMGGCLRYGGPVPLCESLDLQCNEWTQHQNMLQGMWQPIAAMVRNTVYVLFNTHEANNKTRSNDITVQSYEPDQDKWSYMKPFPQDITSDTNGARAVSVGDSILVAGGNIKMCARYTPSTDTWAKLTPSHRVHNYGGLVHYGEKVYLLGGWHGSWHDVVEEYDLESDEWRESSFKLKGKLDLPQAFVIYVPTK